MKSPSLGGCASRGHLPRSPAVVAFSVVGRRVPQEQVCLAPETGGRQSGELPRAARGMFEQASLTPSAPELFPKKVSVAKKEHGRARSSGRPPPRGRLRTRPARSRLQSLGHLPPWCGSLRLHRRGAGTRPRRSGPEGEVGPPSEEERAPSRLSFLSTMPRRSSWMARTEHCTIERARRNLHGARKQESGKKTAASPSDLNRTLVYSNR